MLQPETEMKLRRSSPSVSPIKNKLDRLNWSSCGSASPSATTSPLDADETSHYINHYARRLARR
jgi:hypothetical protein